MKKITTLILMIFSLVFTSACSCGKSDPTSEDYSEAFGALVSKIYKKDEEATVKALSYVDSSQTNDRNYYAVGAYSIFLREAFKNENFDVLNEEMVYFTSEAKVVVENQNESMPLNANLKLKYVDGVIKTDLYTNSGDESAHMIIDMEYDFEKEELKSFDLYYKFMYKGQLTQLAHYKGEGDTISILEDKEDEDYSSVLSLINSRYESFSNELENPKNIGDYSVEYTTAMVEQINFVFGEGTARPEAE